MAASQKERRSPDTCAEHASADQPQSPRGVHLNPPDLLVWRIGLTLKLTCRGRFKSLMSRETVMRPRSGAACGLAANYDQATSPFSFVLSFKTTSSTPSLGASRDSVSSAQIVNPHFSKTRIEPILCFATWA